MTNAILCGMPAEPPPDAPHMRSALNADDGHAASELPDAAGIARLVDTFYDRVSGDPVIGPIFNAVVHDWVEHKALLTSFWCSVVLRAGTYRGNPLSAHRALPIEGMHFDYWLALWEDTAAAVLPPGQAACMLGYAQRIRRGLEIGLALDKERSTAKGLDLPVLKG